MTNMRVIKRNGSFEDVSYDKIVNRIKYLCKPLSTKLGLTNLCIDIPQLVIQVISQLYTGISTSEIDIVTAEHCAALYTQSLHYGYLASRIVISNHQKNTLSSFSGVIKKIQNSNVSMLDRKLYAVVEKYQEELDTFIDYDRDYLIDYFGFKTLERAYLLKVSGKIVERPQHLWMRVAIGIHGFDIKRVKETYELMSLKYFTHATPTLFNAGTSRPQLSSCYLVAMEDDCINGIFNTLKECALISKWAGGIGMHIHNIRSTGSHIRGTNGSSNGIVPMLRVFNSTARYVDQGGGKRSGSIAIYLEPWHPDICEWLELKKNHGDEELRARDLFYALWIPDLFMKKVKQDDDWHLFCPDSAPNLHKTHGEEFVKLYEQYVKEGKARQTIKARELWFKILDSQMETGTPYLLFKDAANNKSNQQNLGTICSSNLCTEVIEYSDSNQTAVCNLASIGLSKFVCQPSPFSNKVKIYTKEHCIWCTRLKELLTIKCIQFTELVVTNENFEEFKKEHNVLTVPQLYDGNKRVGGYNKIKTLLQSYFDFDKLHEVTKVITRNLNNVIDINFYPTEKTRRSNLLHRPIGIGVQGLADVFAMMDFSFDSDEAKTLNKNIFETIYHASLEMTCQLAKERANDMKIIINKCKDSSYYPFKDKLEPLDVSRTYHVSNDNVYEKALQNIKPIYQEINAALSGNPLGAYSSFSGSPLAKGTLQFDMWNVKPSNRYDWNTLKNDIIENGTRNSLLVAPMPTASTSQILGNNECFEPFTSNIYTRRTIAGDYIVINKHLMCELEALGIWNTTIKDMIIKNKGSIQTIEAIPESIRKKYKIAWELSMRTLIDMAADRGPFICQSQSLNLWLEEPSYASLTAMHFYSWQKGLKTGIYYLRRKPKHQPQQFTIDPSKEDTNTDTNTDTVETPPILGEGECEMCSA